MNERPERTRPTVPEAPRDDPALPVDDKSFWHDGYEPIRRRRDDEPTDVGWPVEGVGP